MKKLKDYAAESAVVNALKEQIDSLRMCYHCFEITYSDYIVRVKNAIFSVMDELETEFGYDVYDVIIELTLYADII